jgi:hypothetical protein
MANYNKPVGLAVAQIVDLATIDASSYNVGTQAWVVSSGSNGAAWSLVFSTATVDHTTVEAVLNEPLRRWIPGGTGVALPVSIANGGTSATTAAAALIALGAQGQVVAPWFAARKAEVTALLPTVTDAVLVDDFWTPVLNFTVSAVNSGTIALGGSTLSLQSGATASSNETITSIGGSTYKPIPLQNATQFAVAVRVTKIANTATCDNKIIGITDGISSVIEVGIIGATSTTNYSIKIGTGAAVDTGLPQSPAGIYDDLTLYCDGTNYYARVNGVSSGGQSVSTAAATASLIQIAAANGATAANAGFKLDKLMFMAPAAS